MNEKTKKFLTDARNKAEDAIVKAKAFIEKHPVACTIGGIAASSVVAGVIGKKIGFNDGDSVGYERALCEEDEWIQGSQDLSKCFVNVSERVQNRGDKLGDILNGAMLMHMEDGDVYTVFKHGGKLMVDTDTGSDIVSLVDEKFHQPIDTIARVKFDEWMGHN
jgi:hypothetical protein